MHRACALCTMYGAFAVNIALWTLNYRYKVCTVDWEKHIELQNIFYKLLRIDSLQPCTMQFCVNLASASMAAELVLQIQTAKTAQNKAPIRPFQKSRVLAAVNLPSI